MLDLSHQRGKPHSVVLLRVALTFWTPGDSEVGQAITERVNDSESFRRNKVVPVSPGYS